MLYVLTFTFTSKTVKHEFYSIRIPTTVETLLIGDSHGATLLDDSLIASSINLCNNSESIFLSYYKIKLLAQSNNHIKRVVLVVGPHSFSDYYNDIENSPRLKNYYFCLPIDEQLKMVKDKNIYFSDAFISTSEELKRITKGLPSSAIGGFQPETGNLLEKNVIKDRIQKQFYFEGRRRQISVNNSAYFDSIIDLCSSLNVNLICLNSPVHSSYKEKIPSFFSSFYYKKMNSEKIEYLDFANYNVDASNFLPDGDHVNSNGAQKFSVFFNNYINQ